MIPIVSFVELLQGPTLAPHPLKSFTIQKLAGLNMAPFCEPVAFILSLCSFRDHGQTYKYLICF